jgi:anaerobic selenocysteine-containing dehydrogenase
MKNQKTTRREFLKTSAAGIAAIGIVSQIDLNEKTSAATVELDEITVAELQSKF